MYAKAVDLTKPFLAADYFWSAATLQSRTIAVFADFSETWLEGGRQQRVKHYDKRCRYHLH